MNPSFKVRILDYNDKPVEVVLFQLLQWKHAMNIEVKTGMIHSQGSVVTHVRKLLSAPRTVSREALANHIATSVDDIINQLEPL
jgi:hypothetical protein